jgi:hypothetical protein
LIVGKIIAWKDYQNVAALKLPCTTVPV